MNTEDIHETFPDEAAEAVAPNEFDSNPIKSEDSEFAGFSEPKKNLVTETPPIDREEDKDAEKSENPKNKKSALLLFGLFAGVVLIGILVVVFFIARGNSKETAVVKDNSAKYGINTASSSSGDQPDFQSDYNKRYGIDSNSANNSPPNSAPAANSSVPSLMTNNPPGMTAPPSFNPTASIFQTTPTPTPAPTPAATPSNPASSGPSAGGGQMFSSSGRANNGGESSSAPSRVNENVRFADDPDGRAAANYRQGGRNEQVSLYFYDPATQSAGGGGSGYSRLQLENDAPVKPDFGTLLPVRMLGRIHTLGTNGFARMELTRTVQGNWGTIPGGTLFVGRVSGGEGNRVFVSLVGYIDARSGRLVTLGGDVQGTDGALGMKGDVKKLGSRWTKVFAETLSAAKEIGSAYLLGRNGGSGTVVNTGQLDRLPDALENKDAQKYTLVQAGSLGYIFINDLPPAVESDEKLASNPAGNVPDDELLRMIQKSTEQDIQKMIPNLSPKGQLIARQAIETK